MFVTYAGNCWENQVQIKFKNYVSLPDGKVIDVGQVCDAQPGSREHALQSLQFVLLEGLLQQDCLLQRIVCWFRGFETPFKQRVFLGVFFDELLSQLGQHKTI